MSPNVRSAAGPLTDGMAQVSRNPSHFRTGRWLLAVEGVLLIVSGAAGFLSTATHPDAPPVGAPVLGLALTPWHSGLLLGFGMLVLIGMLNRRTAITVTATGAVAFLMLVIYGAVAASHHAPGPLGLQPSSIVLHAAIATLNFAALYWLLPDVLEGPDWVRRPRTRRRPPSTTSPAGDAVVPGAHGDPTTAATRTAPSCTETTADNSPAGRGHPFDGEAGGGHRAAGTLDTRSTRIAAPPNPSRHARPAIITATALAAAALIITRRRRR